ncbi:SAF domain-containing protein [Bifidobacterium sp. DSM 109959]|uniref:SAF domain-containing protein n=2 Tax=Bifidobacterium olomucense TaxID=2675324 RepID=A0A7Y0HVC8_9BIFI|nr:SAF domain-containing protein [Bifidobacterium sp. DSM 109959]
MVCMVTFSVLGSAFGANRMKRSQGSLRQRRALRTLRRLTAAMCVGFGLLFGLEAVLAAVQTAPLVVAVEDIARGETIQRADVRLVHVAQTAAGVSMASDCTQVIGKIAQIEIHAQDPISTHMARDAPVVPAGSTVIDVQLASSIHGLIAGDCVDLVSAASCDSDECILAENAMVIQVGGEASQDAMSNDALGDASRHATMSMTPEHASNVMHWQQNGAVIAVMR